MAILLPQPSFFQSLFPLPAITLAFPLINPLLTLTLPNLHCYVFLLLQSCPFCTFLKCAPEGYDACLNNLLFCVSVTCAFFDVRMILQPTTLPILYLGIDSPLSLSFEGGPSPPPFYGQ